MSSNIDISTVNFKNELLDELMEKTHCLCCGDTLDGNTWSQKPGLIAKPTYMNLEFCYLSCEREYSNMWGYAREVYNRKTKFN